MKELTEEHFKLALEGAGNPPIGSSLWSVIAEAFDNASDIDSFTKAINNAANILIHCTAPVRMGREAYEEIKANL